MPKSLEQKIGEVLKELRLGIGLSQQALAYESDLERSYISALELGQKMASTETIFKLSGALGVKPSEFIRMVEEKK